MNVFIYDIVTRIYFTAIRIAALFNSKARKWVAGRRNVFRELENLKPSEGLRIWMHCASHGEFEQGRPLLEALKERYPAAELVLTFFSPSGMEHASWQELTDTAFYLPADSRKNAGKFLHLVQPYIAIFVKYELWYHYLSALHRRKIPAVLIAASFRSDQVFFRWYGCFFRKMLAHFNLVLVQYRDSARLLDGIGLRKHAVCGDPRFERAANVAASDYRNEILEAFCNGKQVLIAGSTWPADKEMLSKAFASQKTDNWKLVLVPHEIDRKRISQFAEQLPGTLVYSALEKAGPGLASAKVLVIDQMGLLSRIYRYGTAAYVGGAMGGTGLHNIIEPAAYGLPVMFGPHHRQFPEAQEMLARGIAAVVKNADELVKALEGFARTQNQKEIREAAGRLFDENGGVTGKMLEHLLLSGLLPNKKADFQN
ncbi:MAG: glycosyltransferase N-terminal domain-containing protein [Saprospiraceae bacterium]